MNDIVRVLVFNLNYRELWESLNWHGEGSVFDNFINDSTEDELWAENLAGQD